MPIKFATMSRQLLVGLSLIALLVFALLIPSGSLLAQGEGKAGSVASSKSALSSRELIVQRFKAVLPDLPIDSVSETQAKGIYGVTLGDGEVLYTTADGRHFFNGDMFGLTDTKVVNLAEAQRTSLRERLLKENTVNQGLVFAATGTRKTTINVFTDVDCGYCRKLHQEVPELNAMGIEVRYLAYPRAGLGSESYRKIVSAWCAKDPHQALTALKAGSTVPTKMCDSNPVADQYALGQRMGISGTPAIVLDDGTLIAGYLPAKQLAENLGL